MKGSLTQRHGDLGFGWWWEWGLWVFDGEWYMNLTRRREGAKKAKRLGVFIGCYGEAVIVAGGENVNP